LTGREHRWYCQPMSIGATYYAYYYYATPSRAEAGGVRTIE
jgi:hypothetical protein